MGDALVLRADAASLPLPAASVDLIVTSPPYWALRSYADGGEHYAGQIGAEATPAAYLDALIGCTREWMRVLKPTGSIWVNLGDKYVADRRGPNGESSTLTNGAQPRPGAGAGVAGARPRGGSRAATGAPKKSLIGLPWRYAIRCIDDLGLILRAEVVWSKPNGLPESVTDRVRRSHETWLHFTLQQRYYADLDAIREAHSPNTHPGRTRTVASTSGNGVRHRTFAGNTDTFNPAGRLPGSVWTVATEPLDVPNELGVDHYAAFPTEWPRRIISGWSPTGICTACGEGRRSDVERRRVADRPGRVQGRSVDALLDAHGQDGRAGSRYSMAVETVGEACACPNASAPTTPAVVLDPFGGTGTTALVASVLGRRGVTVDRSADYCRLARWRCADPGQRAKAMRVSGPAPQLDGQLDLLAASTA